jgi:hypothetical protein
MPSHAHSTHPAHHSNATHQGVPELDGLVAGARDDLAVVDREGHGEHVLGVAHEAARRLAGLDLPQAEGAVPGTGERELAVRGDDHVRHEVAVAAQGALGLLWYGWVPEGFGLVWFGLGWVGLV